MTAAGKAGRGLLPPASRSEAGFSLLEALLALAISALVVALVLPMSSTGARRGAALSELGLSIREELVAESALRALLRDAVAGPDGTGLTGDANSLAFRAEGIGSSLCPTSVPGHARRLRIERSRDDGRLVCSDGRTTRPILSWTGAAAHFDYSADGARWSDRWPPKPRRGRDGPTVHEPLVRFNVTDRTARSWIVRAADRSHVGAPQ